jgi:hypothetical protein
MRTALCIEVLPRMAESKHIRTEIVQFLRQLRTREQMVWLNSIIDAETGFPNLD